MNPLGNLRLRPVVYSWMRLFVPLLLAVTVMAQQRPGFRGTAQEEQAADVVRAASNPPIERWRNSTDPRERAWAIWLSWTTGHPDAREDARKLLASVALDARASARPFGDVHALTLTALDAAIQLRLSLPPENIEPFAEHYPVQTFVLLSLATPATEASDAGFLSRWEKNVDPELGGVLFERKTPGLASAVLRGFSTLLSVHVRDDAALDGIGGGGGIGIGCGALSLAKGFPPTGVYKRGAGLTGDQVLASLPRPVYYRREVVPTSQQIGWSESHTRVDPNQLREELLAAMVNRDLGDPIVRSYERLDVRWAGVEHLRVEVEAAKRDFAARFEQLQVDLVARGWLRFEERLASGNLDVTVLDQREDASEPLPELQ
jgi:hypothetical protein